jgi:hypothetical protein
MPFLEGRHLVFDMLGVLRVVRVAEASAAACASSPARLRI